MMETGESVDSLCGHPVFFVFRTKQKHQNRDIVSAGPACAFVLDLFVALVYIGSSIDQIRQLIIITEMLLDEKILLTQTRPKGATAMPENVNNLTIDEQIRLVNGASFSEHPNSPKRTYQDYNFLTAARESISSSFLVTF